MGIISSRSPEEFHYHFLKSRSAGKYSFRFVYLKRSLFLLYSHKILSLHKEFLDDSAPPPQLTTTTSDFNFIPPGLLFCIVSEKHSTFSFTSVCDVTLFQAPFSIFIYLLDRISYVHVFVFPYFAEFLGCVLSISFIIFFQSLYLHFLYISPL